MAAAQDYSIINQPSIACTSQIDLVNKKEQSAQKKGLADLATALKSLEMGLYSAKSSATSLGASAAPSTLGSEAQGPSSDSLKETLAQMAGALQFLQVKIAKYAQSKAGSEGLISKAELTVAQDNLKKVTAEIKKLKEEEERRRHMSIWEKIGGAIAGSILTLVAAITCQPELLIAAALCFAGTTGLFSDASNGLASVLEKAGCSSEVASILAGVIVTAVVIGATAGMGSAAGVSTAATETASAAADAAEEGIEMVEIGTSGASDLSESIESSESALQKEGSILKKLNLFSRFSARTNLMIMAGAQSAMQTGAVQNLVGTIAYEIAKKCDKKDADKIRSEVERISEIIVAVMAILATAGSGAAMGEGAIGAAESGSEAAGEGISAGKNFLKELFQGFQEFGLSASGQRLFAALSLATGLEQSGTGIAAGAYEIMQGKGEKKLSDYHADAVLNNVAMSMENAEMKSSQDFLAQRERQFKVSDRVIGNLNKGEAAFAQLLCSSAV